MSNNNELRWLVADLNSFFASCEQQANPDLRQKPLAVVPVETDTTCVIAASYEAKAKGIKTGTLVREAKQMCPDLICVPSRPALYVDFHHKILEAIDTCIPVDDVMSIDEVACRLDKRQKEPEAARALAQQIKSRIQLYAGECMTSSVGIASNRLLAKLASDMQKPNGLTILMPEEMPHPILHLDIDDFSGIGPRMSERLRSQGIDSIADLWAMSAMEMKRAWGGIVGVRFHALLHGQDIPTLSNPPKSMGHQHVLAPEERTQTQSIHVLRQLLTKLGERLRNERFYASRLILQIKWTGFLGYFENDRKFSQTQDTAFLLKMLMDLWKEAPSLTPLRVGVVLADLVPQSAHQFDLFEKRRPAALTQTVDQLNKKFGHGTVNYGADVPTIETKIPFSRVPDRDEFLRKQKK